MSNTDQQPFIGTIIAGVAAKAAVKQVERVAEKILSRDDVACDNTAAPDAAREIAVKAAPAVVEAIKKDPVIQTAINGEPWYQSIIFWIASGGGGAALWTLVELWIANPPVDYRIWIAAIGTLLSSIGVLIRRLQFVPGK